MVLLKNDGVLPFGASVKKILVVGPLAESAEVLHGNYSGTPRTRSRRWKAFASNLAAAQVTYEPGTNFLREMK